MTSEPKAVFAPKALISATKVFPIRMTAEQHESIKNLSAELQISMHDLVLQAIEFALEHRK